MKNHKILLCIDVITLPVLQSMEISIMEIIYIIYFISQRNSNLFSNRPLDRSYCISPGDKIREKGIWAVGCNQFFASYSAYGGESII